MTHKEAMDLSKHYADLAESRVNENFRLITTDSTAIICALMALYYQNEAKAIGECFG